MKTPKPGWYPDPSGANQQRYYDGAKWTEDRAPKRKRSVLKILLGTAAVLFIVWFLIGFFGGGKANAFPYTDFRTDEMSSTTYVYCHWVDDNGVRHGTVTICYHGSDHCTISEEKG